MVLIVKLNEMIFEAVRKSLAKADILNIQDE